jgi:hypothetical protein
MKYIGLRRPFRITRPPAHAIDSRELARRNVADVEEINDWIARRRHRQRRWYRRLLRRFVAAPELAPARVVSGGRWR